MSLNEHRDLHPRAAHWIQSRGDVYLHEMRLSNLGIADFVAINRFMGQVSIVECKLSERSSGDCVDQIERYSQPFEGMNIRRIALFLLPISIAYRAYILRQGITPFVVGYDHPQSTVIQRTQGLPAFDGLFKEYHGQTIADHLYDFDEMRNKQSMLTMRINR